VSRPVRLDFGPDIERGIQSAWPPKAGTPFTTFVSALDADGNEVSGVRPWELRVPLATFTGWNPRHPDQGGAGAGLPRPTRTMVAPIAMPAIMARRK
jgi:hypothetical protein